MELARSSRSMESNIARSILKTVLYSDIFDYPLTAQQIWKYLITTEKISIEDFEKVLKNIKSPVDKKDGWYFIHGRQNLIRKRLKRRKESARKLEIAYEILSKLCVIPTILLLGVSGGVSLHNADRKDDIDIFVIAKKNTIWFTRISIVLLLMLKGKYRKRLDRNVMDKICLNMLIDERGLAFNSDRQDLYNAHEIIQMKPIFSRSKFYEKFISKNLWVKNFIPNSLDTKILRYEDKNKKKQSAISYLLFAVEIFAKTFQLWYIKRHISRETVSDGMVAFHPFDRKEEIMKLYRERLKKYGRKI